MVTILIGAFLGSIVGVVVYLKRKDGRGLDLPLTLLALGTALGLVGAIVAGWFIPQVPIDKVGEYSLKPLDGVVYVAHIRSKYVVNTGVAGFDSAFLVELSEVDYDSASSPRVEVYNSGHIGSLKYFTLTPPGIYRYRIIVPDKYSVKKIP